MSLILMLALSWLSPSGPNPKQDVFLAQGELQGLYDELSQAQLQFATAQDVDELHTVFFAPDWVLIDEKGDHHSWSDVRQDAVVALETPPADSLDQVIDKISLTDNGAKVQGRVITVRTIVDNEGKYGKTGATHTLTETSSFRDEWIRSGESWKAQSRTRVGKPSVVVDKKADY